jgi:hypothetical protein
MSNSLHLLSSNLAIDSSYDNSVNENTIRMRLAIYECYPWSKHDAYSMVLSTQVYWN